MNFPDCTTSPSPTRRQRVRSVLPTLFLGFYPPGPKNSITDVPGVLVSTQSVHAPAGHDPSRPTSVINTGVTVILPRKDWFTTSSYAGIHRFNGNGELTGSHWINETGLLNSPIVLTNTFSVGVGYTGVYQYAVREYADKETGLADWFVLPVVGETYDGLLNDVGRMAVTPEMVVRGIEEVSDEVVREGNTGGGTAMTCSGFKAGTGSSSRVVDGVLGGDDMKFTVGVLVQANFGGRRGLKFGNVPVGRLYPKHKTAGVEEEDEDTEERTKQKDGSIIVIIATDAPLNPTQLTRLAQRATVGLSKTGGFGANYSGDIFLAFSTGNAVPKESKKYSGPKDPSKLPGAPVMATPETRVDLVHDTTMDPLFEATADATEEAILNSLCMAETMEGPNGRRMEAIDLETLKAVVDKYGGGK